MIRYVLDRFEAESVSHIFDVTRRRQRSLTWTNICQLSPRIGITTMDTTGCKQWAHFQLLLCQVCRREPYLPSRKVQESYCPTLLFFARTGLRARSIQRNTL